MNIGACVRGIPIQPKPRSERICHGIIIKDGQLEHQQLCSKYVITTRPDSFSIEFKRDTMNYIKRISLFLTDYEFDVEKKPINSEARAIILDDFEEDTPQQKNMDLLKAIRIMEMSNITVEVNSGHVIDQNPIFAWDTYWANVIARRQMPFNVSADEQSLDLLPIRIGWVCPATTTDAPVSDIDINIRNIEANPVPISAQFHIDVEVFDR